MIWHWMLYIILYKFKTHSKYNSNTYYYFPFNLVKHMILILSFCEFVLLLFIINVMWSICLFLLFYLECHVVIVFRKVIVHWKREGIFNRGHLFPNHKTADKIQTFFEKHELLLKPEPRSGLNSWQQI
jgi:hypothetical protein